MKMQYFLLLGFGLIATLLVSCKSETESTGAPPPTELITSAGVSPSPFVPTPSPIAEIASTINISRTSGSVSSVTPSITLESTPLVSTLTLLSISTATWTPLPTLEGEELELAIAELLENPMNCDVPCWWGAIPGVTSLYEIRHAISPYNFHISEYEEEGEVVYLLVETGYIEEQDDYEIGIVYNFSNALLIGVTAYSGSLGELLIKYGQPDEVWLETMSTERETLPFRLNLVYLQKGMAVGYVVDGDIQDNEAIGCFTDDETGYLRLIAPYTVNGHEDFSPIFEEDRRYLPLEEATGLTMDDFMQRFTDPTQPHCIATPAELWE